MLLGRDARPGEPAALKAAEFVRTTLMGEAAAVAMPSLCTLELVYNLSICTERHVAKSGT